MSYHKIRLKVLSLSKGFTIVELVVVITIMGILMTLGTVQIMGSQSKARDAERKADIETIAMHLEIYYREKGQYPPSDKLGTDPRTELKDMDPNSIWTPNNKGNSALLYAPDTNQPTTLTKDNYMYQPLQADGQICTAEDKECRKFVLYAYLENQIIVNGVNTNFYTVESKNQ